MLSPAAIAGVAIASTGVGLALLAWYLVWPRMVDALRGAVPLVDGAHPGTAPRRRLDEVYTLPPAADRRYTPLPEGPPLLFLGPADGIVPTIGSSDTVVPAPAREVSQ